MNNQEYDIVNDPHNLHQPDPPMNRRAFQPNPTVPVKSDADGNIILEDGCWLLIGGSRWNYDSTNGEYAHFCNPDILEAQPLDRFNQYRTFSYSELETLIKAGFLYMNKPTQMTMPMTGPKVRGKE